MSNQEQESPEEYLNMMKDLSKWPSYFEILEEEIYHIDNKGNIREVNPLSDEASELFKRFDNAKNI